MSNEKKKLIYIFCGFIFGSVVSTICTSVIAKKNQEKKSEKEMGLIVIYPDAFKQDSMYLQLDCSLEDLKSLPCAKFKIYYDKDNKKVQDKEKFAKS